MKGNEINNIPFIPPHLKLEKLRKGEKVPCSACKVGFLLPIGDCKITNTFSCNQCNNQLIIN